MAYTSIETKKKRILEAYNYAPTWVYKVEKMSDKQIHAIYMRIINNK